MRRPFALATLLFGLVSCPEARAQTCPDNFFSMGSSAGYYEESPTDPRWSRFGFAYDLISGNLSADLVGAGEAGTAATLTLRDRYVIVGPAATAPIPLRVRVHFEGLVGGGTVDLPSGPTCLGSSALLRVQSDASVDEASVQSESSPCGPVPYNQDLVLDLEKLPGEEFPLTVTVSLHAGHQIAISLLGSIIFSDLGLPQRYELQSCQGYTGIPVPAVARSWGSIKGLYR